VGATQDEESRDPILAPDARLNEHQQRHLLASCQYIDQLLAEIEEIVVAGQAPQS
jgi:hypothetical protein